MQNLVLGIIDKYNFDNIRTFVLSLDAFIDNVHVCLYAGPKITSSTIKKIEKLGIEVIRYNKDFPFIAAPHPQNFQFLPSPIHIYNFRHYLYYDYLLKKGSSFENVLITDVKDVVFQKNPFDFLIEDKLYVAVESLAIPIKDCEWTSGWIQSGYGVEILDQMKDKEVICAGTTLAPMNVMKKYLHRLIQEFSAVNNVFDCADQAMHNVLLHRQLLEPVFKCYNFKSPILTVGTEKTYLLNKQNQLVTEDGEIIPTIHQYDRHEELIKIFATKYSRLGIFKKYLQGVFGSSSR